MNLRAIDLNLLVALDALLTERHVSRAAVRIGLSQPAMSNALSRIRTLFRDDILVRTSHGMEPTPRAARTRRCRSVGSSSGRTDVRARVGFRSGEFVTLV